MVKIHPTADVQSTSIGSGTTIWQSSIILPGASIGTNCNINAFCFIENDVVIGNNVTIKCGVYLWDGIVIEDNVMIGPNVTFTNDIYPRSKKSFQVARTIIKKGSSIGANSTILGGITISEYSLIGAGSVLTKNTSGNSLWVGNPARFMSYVCNCGNKLSSDLVCAACNESYSVINGNLNKRI